MQSPSDSSLHSPLSNRSDYSEASNHEYWLEAQFQKIFAKDPSKHHDFNFYMEYCRLLLINAQLVTQVRKEVIQVEHAKQDKLQLERKLASRANQRLGTTKEQHSDSNSGGKRNRRLAGEIARHYLCTVKNCQKSYGSEGSLNQHIRLKHPT